MKSLSLTPCAISNHPLVVGVRYAHGLCDLPPDSGFSLENVDIAVKHRVVPSLCRALVSGGANLPKILEEHLALEAQRHLLRRSVMGALLEQLHCNGIGALIYKGRALDFLYNGILRPTGDVDLIVHSSDVAGVREAADHLGVRWIQVAGDEISFSLNGVLVEIHTQLVERYIAHLPHTTSLFKRSVQCPNAAHTWRTLAPADHLVALLVHGFKHQWCRLGWILDIALLKRHMSNGELVLAAEIARAHKVESAFGLGLDLAEHTLSSSPTDNPVARRYAERLFDPGTSLGFKLENIALHLRVLDGCASRSRYIYKRGRSALRAAWRHGIL